MAGSSDTPFSQREFREALAGFATGVTIITTCSPSGEKIGMTASGFNSVSMDPPLILWSVTKTAYSAPTFKEAEHFCVHILSADQVETSNRFAAAGTDKFSGVSHTVNAFGVPMLDEYVSRFDCRMWAVYEGGDHWILVGQVQNLQNKKREGLVFSRGQYATSSPLSLPAVGSKPVEVSDGGEIENLLIYKLARLHRELTDQFYKQVHDSGLTVSEWRVLASLYGEASRTLDDLQARTFVEMETLTDMVVAMQQEGLCQVDLGADPPIAAGTKQGSDRVDHLIKLSESIEQDASHGVDLDGLKSQLAGMMKNVM